MDILIGSLVTIKKNKKQGAVIGRRVLTPGAAELQDIPPKKKGDKPTKSTHSGVVLNIQLVDGDGNSMGHENVDQKDVTLVDAEYSKKRAASAAAQNQEG